VPNRLLVVAVGLLLIGTGVNGVRTGRVLGRIGSVQRADNALRFWVRVTLYAGLGVLCLCYAWTQYASRPFSLP
jgi:hypothetical protein